MADPIIVKQHVGKDQDGLDVYETLELQTLYEPRPELESDEWHEWEKERHRAGRLDFEHFTHCRTMPLKEGGMGHQIGVVEDLEAEPLSFTPHPWHRPGHWAELEQPKAKAAEPDE